MPFACLPLPAGRQGQAGATRDAIQVEEQKDEKNSLRRIHRVPGLFDVCISHLSTDRKRDGFEKTGTGRSGRR